MPDLRPAAALALSVALAASPADARRGAAPPAVEPLRASHLVLPGVDVDRLLAEDAKAEARGPGPRRFALPIDVVVSPWSDGAWTELGDGSRLWRFGVHSPAATDLNFGFRSFRLPEGAALWIVSEETGKHEGPYTHEDNEEHGELWTPVVRGDRATIVLLVPPNPATSPELELNVIGHGYRDFLGGGLFTPKSGACNNDVVCPEGDPWRDQINSEAGYSFGGGLSCSGQMIMDVPRTFRNWFLTANHCGVRDNNAASIVVYWNFQASTCGGPRDGQLDDNQTGAIFRSRLAAPDTCLIELDDDPDPAWNVYYSGWDRSDVPPTGTVGIHHPSGDEKAITFNTDPPVHADSCIGGANDSHWWISEYEDGTTEGGSSGSGLWDIDSQLLIGVLSGGGAACSRPNDGDCYGRFAEGWDRGNSADQRLRDWLDPGDAGDLTVPGGYPTATARYASHSGVDSCSLGAGDANSVWEPGEDIELDVALVAGGDLTGVTATLTTSTPGVTINTNAASWPDLASGVPQVNSAPGFHLTLDSVACYGDIDFELTIDANEGGPWISNFTQSVGLPNTPDVPKPIVDNGTATSELVVADSFPLNSVAVRVQATHSFVGDLRLTLRAPDGREAVLLDRPDGGNCADEDMDVLFDDASGFDAQAHCAGDMPWLNGDAMPVDPLGVFVGMDVQGTWTLVVEDLAGGDDGSVTSWELVTDPPLQGQCQACSVAPCTGTEISTDELRVAKAPGGEIAVSFTGPDSACAVGVQMRMATTARPAAGGGSFPMDPSFADVTGDDLDAGPAFRHAPPAGNLFYLVVEELPDGSTGPSGHYGF